MKIYTVILENSTTGKVIFETVHAHDAKDAYLKAELMYFEYYVIEIA